MSITGQFDATVNVVEASVRSPDALALVRADRWNAEPAKAAAAVLERVRSVRRLTGAAKGNPLKREHFMAFSNAFARFNLYNTLEGAVLA